DMTSLCCIYLYRDLAHRALHPFPTRRSSDLESLGALGVALAPRLHRVDEVLDVAHGRPERIRKLAGRADTDAFRQVATRDHRQQDRKSTRLNSSHVKISYAVFCLKKKTKSKP